MDAPETVMTVLFTFLLGNGCVPGQPRATPPPRYHSPSLASVNGRCMASPCRASNTTTLASFIFYADSVFIIFC